MARRVRREEAARENKRKAEGDEADDGNPLQQAIGLVPAVEGDDQQDRQHPLQREAKGLQQPAK